MFIDLMRQGGPVLWVILGSGVLAFVVFVERSLHLHRARIRADDFLSGITNVLKRKNVEEALTICDDTPGPVSHLVKTAILQRGEGKERIRAALEEAKLAEISRMERRLIVIATVAQLAPLLGLLGTVLGMVEALLSMYQQAPLIQSADVLGGAMRALVATAAGLTVAIPCYAGFNMLVVKIDRIVLDMDRTVLELIAFLSGVEGGPKDDAA
jgi:biopolymer transport protein ExbB